jgi:hypothetical protein
MPDVTNRSPAGLKAAVLTVCFATGKDTSLRPVATSHGRTVPPTPAVSSCVPEGAELHAVVGVQRRGEHHDQSAAAATQVAR